MGLGDCWRAGYKRPFSRWAVITRFTSMTFVVRFAADDVCGVVIPDAGHWLMQEQPARTVAAIVAFLQPNESRTSAVGLHP